MKNLFAVLILTAAAFGQSVTSTPIVTNQFGQPVANVLVTVCGSNPGTGACPTLVPIYTDQTLGHQCTGSGASLNNLTNPSAGAGCSNPGFTDGLGNVVVFTSPGLLWCQYSSPSISAVSVPCTASGTVSNLSVESFGAVGDWNGGTGTGTDNTAAIQACLNVVIGNCVLQAKAYKISGTLTINRSLVGIVGTAGVVNAPAFYPNPPASSIITTSSTADIIDVFGTSLNNALVGNVIKNVTLNRNIAPTSQNAAGVSLKFTYAAILDGVTVNDSQVGFNFRGTGSAGYGYVENCSATWGYNGVVSGFTNNLIGFNIDTSGSIDSPSLRIRNTSATNNLGAGTGGRLSFGYSVTGNIPADLHLTHPETANTDYGLYVISTGVGFPSAQDMMVNDAVFSACFVTCDFISGVQGNLNIIGGFHNIHPASTAANPIIEILNSTRVKILGAEIQSTASPAGAAIIVHGGATDYVISGNDISGNNNTAISLNAANRGSITGNTINGITTTNLISIVNSSFVTVASNSLNGVVTNGISVDSNSHGIGGLETNTYSGTIPTLITDSGGNYTSTGTGFATLQGVSPSLLCSSANPTVTSGFNTNGTLGSSPNGSCSFFVTIGSGAATNTGVIGLPSASHGWNCLAFNQNRGAYIAQTANSASSVTMTNYGTTFAATNWTNGDSILVTCTGR